MQHFRYPFMAMACNNLIKLYAESPAAADAAAAAAIAEVTRIEAKYSRYRDDSVVTAINRAAGLDPIEIDTETSQLLDYADACFHESAGMFDITSGVLRRVWNFKPGAMTSLPTATALAPVLNLIGWKKFRRLPLRRKTERVQLTVAGMEIDFGGFGKEYAADRAAAILLAHGMKHAFVNMGGDVVVTGPQANGETWQLGIQHPRQLDNVIASLPIRVGAVATSGDYERYVEINGVRHSHVLNPQTGLAVQGPQSVTVFAPTCLVAGSIATIAMLKADTESWLRDSGADYLAVHGDGRVTLSPALQPHLSSAAQMRQ